MEKQKLYFHVGLPKTGTTTIQEFLWNNHHILKKYGMNYPLFKHSQPIRYNINGIDFSKNANKLKDIKEPIIIISSEDFPSQVNFLSDDLLNKYDVKIIIYVRRAVDAIISLWAEIYKNIWREARSKQEDINFAEKKFFNYSMAIFEYIGEKIEPENVIVRPFETEQMLNGDALEDFLNIFDLKLQNEEYIVNCKNVSPSYDTIEAMRLFYAPLVRNLYPHNFREIINNKGVLDITDSFVQADCGSNKLSPCNLLTDDKIKEICDKYYPIECNIAKKYLGRDELFLSKYPSCYLKPHEKFEGIFLSNKQIELITQEIKNIKYIHGIRWQLFKILRYFYITLRRLFNKLTYN